MKISQFIPNFIKPGTSTIAGKQLELQNAQSKIAEAIKARPKDDLLRSYLNAMAETNRLLHR